MLVPWLTCGLTPEVFFVCVLFALCKDSVADGENVADRLLTQFADCGVPNLNPSFKASMLMEVITVRHARFGSYDANVA